MMYARMIMTLVNIWRILYVNIFQLRAHGGISRPGRRGGEPSIASEGRARGRVGGHTVHLGLWHTFRTYVDASGSSGGGAAGVGITCTL